MGAGTIRGLGLLIQLLSKACEVIGVFGPKIRTFVPEASQADYDVALIKIMDACAVIKAIEYIGDLVT